MNQTTPGTEAGFDLDKHEPFTAAELDEIEAVARAAPQMWYGTYQIVDGISDEKAVELIEACSPDTILTLIALARRAAPATSDMPDTTASALELFKQWKAYPLPEFNDDGNFDWDWLHREWVAFKAGLARVSLAPVSTQQSAAKLAKVETFTIPHVSSRGNVFVLLSDLADGPVSAQQGAARQDAVECDSALRAEPAGRVLSAVADLTDEEIAEICFRVRPAEFIDEYGDVDYLRYDAAVIRAASTELATRCRAEGGDTNEESGAAPSEQQAAPEQAEPPRMSTDEAREYLVKFMEQHFTDKTFHRYIRGDTTRASILAGDFAWQMARAIRMVLATQASAIPNSKGASHE